MSSSQIARTLIEYFEEDSGAGIGSLTVFPKYMRELESAISGLQREGLSFSEEEFEEIALGEASEREEVFGHYRTWPKLDRVLNEIFDGSGGEWNRGLMS